MEENREDEEETEAGDIEVDVTNEGKSSNEGTTLHREEEKGDIDGSDNEEDDEGEGAVGRTSIGSEGHSTDPS